MLKRAILALMLATLFLPAEAMSGTISLPQTGQTTSYAAGDDGALKIGVAWPNPRFTANANQTVTDNLTGLIWAKDAGTPTVGSCTGGTKPWQAALDYVACLNTANYLGYNDWRLPNINELESLVHDGLTDIVAWPNSQGFANVQYWGYWSSTTYASATSNAWLVGVCGSYVNYGPKSISLCYVVPVRSGQSGSVGISAIWSTGQTTTYATGDDGALKKGVAWPNPRFTDNSNNTVTDNLTGLVWAKDAGTPTVGSIVSFFMCTGGTKTWQAALNYVACLNAYNYLGYRDWRLPNRKELSSLVDRGRYTSSIPSGHPFSNLQSSDYWSSTTYASVTSNAWLIDMSDGYVYSDDDKTSSHYVWPVRGGQYGASTIPMQISYWDEYNNFVKDNVGNMSETSEGLRYNGYGYRSNAMLLSKSTFNFIGSETYINMEGAW
ncbi:secreted protein containing DUF1566 [Candidatus Magnetobacterium bavaricum]|uniref:Secreted protein containing DUF1566 n=1 Tax=Candidatus Magnetobacterium bavaricum TaxID=29290 RepID=A0A0F3GYT6_9BACT|nr:secreted protein containing DUF1566 [Candidatus Magnetobacterium bavaricum]